jgi:hypothetical protein
MFFSHLMLRTSVGWGRQTSSEALGFWPLGSCLQSGLMCARDFFPQCGNLGNKMLSLFCTLTYLNQINNGIKLLNYLHKFF